MTLEGDHWAFYKKQIKNSNQRKKNVTWRETLLKCVAYIREFGQHIDISIIILKKNFLEKRSNINYIYLLRGSTVIQKYSTLINGNNYYLLLLFKTMIINLIIVLLILFLGLGTLIENNIANLL